MAVLDHVPAAAVLCFIVGYLFGLPALKLEGHYLALATFALALAVPQILKYKWLEGLTGGVQGIVLNKPEVPFGLPLHEDQWLYYYCFVGDGVALLGRQQHPEQPQRPRHDGDPRLPIAADTMGIDTALYKTVTFGISAPTPASPARCRPRRSPSWRPDSFNIFLSIKFLIGLVVGGIGSLAGSVGRRHLLRAGRQLGPGAVDLHQERPRPAVRLVGLHRLRHPADRPDVPDADGHRRRASTC
jgi:branched-chain amino acid transport system permease protein